MGTQGASLRLRWLCVIGLYPNKVQPRIICLHSSVSFVNSFSLGRYPLDIKLVSLCSSNLHSSLHGLCLHLNHLDPFSLGDNNLPWWSFIGLCGKCIFCFLIGLNCWVGYLNCLGLGLCVFKVIGLPMDQSLSLHCVLIVSWMVIVGNVKWGDAIVLNQRSPSHYVRVLIILSLLIGI